MQRLHLLCNENSQGGPAGHGRGVDHAPRRCAYLHTSLESLFGALACEQHLFGMRDLAARFQRLTRAEEEARSWTMILIISRASVTTFSADIPPLNFNAPLARAVPLCRIAIRGAVEKPKQSRLVKGEMWECDIGVL